MVGKGSWNTILFILVSRNSPVKGKGTRTRVVVGTTLPQGRNVNSCETLTSLSMVAVYFRVYHVGGYDGGVGLTEFKFMVGLYAGRFIAWMYIPPTILLVPFFVLELQKTSATFYAAVDVFSGHFPLLVSQTDTVGR